MRQIGRRAVSAIIMSCGFLTGAAAQDTIKIGLNLEQTGVATSYGLHMRIAADMALSEINAAGGINGTKLEFVVEDNRSSPEQAVIATRNLDRAGVVAILGPIQSSQVRTAFPASNRAQVVSVSPGSGAPGLSAQNRPWTFRNAAIDGIIIDELVGKLRAEYPNAKTVAVGLDNKDAYETNLVKNVSPPILAKFGFTRINGDSPIEMPTNTEDFSVFVTRMKAMNPDVVLLGIQFEQAKAFLREANRQRFNVPMYSGLGYVTESVAEAAREIKVYSGQPFDPDSDDPKVKSFVKMFKERSEKELPGQYTTPTYIDAGAYETMMILADALRAAKATATSDVKELRTKVRDHLAGLKDYQGLGNKLSFNEEGDAIKPTLIYRTGNGSRWEKF